MRIVTDSLQIGEGYLSLMALGLPTVLKVIGYQIEEEGITSLLDAVQLIRKKEWQECGSWNESAFQKPVQIGDGKLLIRHAHQSAIWRSENR